MVDNRFIRLASVGLTVLAPSPDACETDDGKPGICDIRLAADDGVDVLRPFAFPGDFPANDDDLLWSGVPRGVDNNPWLCLEGGCRDFVFDARGVVRREVSDIKLLDAPIPRLLFAISDKL